MRIGNDCEYKSRLDRKAKVIVNVSCRETIDVLMFEKNMSECEARIRLVVLARKCYLDKHSERLDLVHMRERIFSRTFLKNIIS